MGEGKSRGELGEIRSTLASLSATPKAKGEALTAKRDVFKKIVNYMTIGIDMSSLFMQVMNCVVASAEDLVLKKMLYLYICTYARSNPDLTLLTINLLTKDCRDQDPMIRGLALRSLCQLRVANLIEYLMAPIQQGLKDAHPYVRRTAVMGVLKVYNMDRHAVHHAGMLDTLQGLLLRDGDAQVVSNCMSVLQQAGLAASLVTRTLIIALINRLKDFSEWAQCQVLEFVSGYRPGSEGEVFDIMNVLDDRLAHSNSAVVMATVKLFLHLTLHMPATHQQVLERVKDPLQTLVSRDQYETAYAVLAHFLLLAQRAPPLFSQARCPQIYTTFYCRQNEPSYIRVLKLEILAALADAGNAYEIAGELTEYVGDADQDTARGAVRAVGRIALEVQDVAGIMERLLGFLELGVPYVTAEALVQVRDLLRRFPELADACIASVSAISPDDLVETEAKAAFVWILGMYGQAIQDAPYLLEAQGARFEAEAAPVQLALLTAAMRLFFKRPPETQRLLGLVLAAGAAQPNPDVRDRALLYFRLLQADVAEAERVVGGALPSVTAFAEEASPEVRDRIFDEFNSLAVIFRAPAATFAAPDPAAASAPAPDSPDLLAPAGAAPADEASALLSDEEQALSIALEGSAATANGSLPERARAAPSGSSAGDLLGMDDLLGGFGRDTPPQPPTAALSQPAPPRLALVPSPQMSPADFQRMWGALPPALQFSHALAPASLASIQANAHQDLCQRAAAQGIATMASGGAPPLFRFYFHAETAEGLPNKLLVEALVSTQASSAAVTLKSQDVGIVQPFAEVFRNVLSGSIS